MTPEQANRFGRGHLPETLGIVATHIEEGEARCELAITPLVLAPNGYLHAGTVVSLADTTAGYGCAANLPEGADGFTTIELKSNHTGTALQGVIECSARMTHGGRTTQVWDATVTHRETRRTIALFRCTQMILYREPRDRQRGR